MSKIKQLILKKIDQLFIKYFTVERGRGKRKYIWETKLFRDVTQIHIPKLLFFGFFVFICWKINDKITDIKSDKFIQYASKSSRIEKIEEDNKHIEYFLNMPNEFDPDKTSDAVSVELKDNVKYEYEDLRNDELQKLDEVSDWIKELREKKSI